MLCPRCRHDNRPGARFCEECATPLARRCASCGAELSGTAKFCPECAHPAAAGAGERVGGTADRLHAGTSRRVDPDQQERARGRAQAGHRPVCRSQGLHLSFFDADPAQDIRPLLPRIAVPTLVTRGTSDWVSGADDAAQLVASIPGARFHGFAGRCHIPIFTATTEFCEVLRAFARPAEREAPR
jgi:pimeloyl-ACP methyl ester carboxylesterase